MSNRSATAWEEMAEWLDKHAHPRSNDSFWCLDFSLCNAEAWSSFSWCDATLLNAAARTLDRSAPPARARPSAALD